MKAGIAHNGRTFLAALTAAVLMASMVFLLADPAARASHEPPDDTVANNGPAGTNDTPYWVSYLSSERGINDASCQKISQAGDDAWEMPDEPAGRDWVLLVVKQAETNFVYYDPVAGHDYPSVGENQPGFSHIIVCSVVETTTTTTLPPTTTTLPPTTTTLPPTTTTLPPTTTTLPPTTTTTVPPTTTTTVPPTTTTTLPPTTTTVPEVGAGEIIVEKVVEGVDTTFEFTFDTVGFTLGDNTLGDGQSSSSGPLAPGADYGVSEDVPPGWTLVGASCDDGSDPANIDLAEDEIVTCTFTNTIETEVQASILVTVAGVCVEDGEDGLGRITVTMSVAGGADVVIRDSDGDVVGNLSADGTITVPEGAVYTWEATPNEGFEFPAGADDSGSITIATCSDPDVLPFTGLYADEIAALGIIMLMVGGLTLLTSRTRRARKA